MQSSKQKIILQAAKRGCFVLLLVSLLISVPSSPCVAGWTDLFEKADTLIQDVSSGEAAPEGSSLANSKIVQGLKEALQLGVKTAIGQLGQQDGFLADQGVRIPLPESLQPVDRLLAGMGQEKLSDQLVTSMNRAAEEAVPEVAGVFAEAVQEMSLADAEQILKGSDDAATTYFKDNTSEMLRQLVRPHVKQAMDKVQVSRYYHLLVAAVQKYDSLGLMNQYLGPASDLEGYVTDKTLDGLLVKIAEQEKLIRDDPGARSTEVLRQVFGSLL